MTLRDIYRQHADAGHRASVQKVYDTIRSHADDSRQRRLGYVDGRRDGFLIGLGTATAIAVVAYIVLWFTT